jgi:hypothetical protein
MKNKISRKTNNSCNATTTTVKKNLFVKEDVLAKKWAIGKQIAHDTIKATTQAFVRNVMHPVERRFKTKNVALRYNHIKQTFTPNTFFANIKSAAGKKCAQLFTTDFGFAKFVPMRSKSEAPTALQEFIRDVGIPDHIHSNGAKEMTLGAWKKTCYEAGIRMTNTEKGSPWQNRTEVEIREIKRHVRLLLKRTDTPGELWDFRTKYVIELRNRLARPLPRLNGRTPQEIITGNTPDISELIEFEWFQPIWYKSHNCWVTYKLCRACNIKKYSRVDRKGPKVA